MPFVRIDLIPGRNKARFTVVGTAILRALMETLEVPQRINRIDGRRR